MRLFRRQIDPELLDEIGKRTAVVIARELAPRIAADISVIVSKSIAIEEAERRAVSRRMFEELLEAGVNEGNFTLTSKRPS